MKMLNLKNANRWKFPSVTYTNFKKLYPQAAVSCWKKWFRFERYWGGRIWNFLVRHHQLSFDFRRSWLDDMVFPDTTSKDRKAVADAEKAIKEGER